MGVYGTFDSLGAESERHQVNQSEKDLESLQFKYDLLKKVLEETSENVKKELDLKEKELQMWKDYAMSQKPREDRLREYIQYLSRKDEDS